jgi:hypothetical protein
MRIVGIALAAAITIVSLWLLNDASTFALMAADPETGRARGCYTALERRLGVLEPSGVRDIETRVGLILLPLAAVTAWRSVRKPRPN